MNTVKHLPAIVLSLGCLVGSTLWVIFSLGQETSILESFSFETERLADQIFRTQLEGELEDHPLPEEVYGFGIFNAQGRRVHAWGDVPDRLPVTGDEKTQNFFLVASSGRTYDFIKVLEPLRPRPRPVGPFLEMPLRAMRPPRPVGLQVQGYLFLKIRDDQLSDRRLFWNIATFAGPVFWAAILFVIGRLWYRNREFQQTLRRNQELLQYTEAARTLSHEIKNPLSAILLQTAILKKLPEGKTSEVRIIEEETRRISQLVERVREFLRDPLGSPVAVDLYESVSSLRDRFSQPIQLSPETSPGWKVRFDPSRLRSVLENLLKNACESGLEPSPSVVLSRPKPSLLRLEVFDRGSGLDDEALKNAFTPFFTKKTTGTGIGLSIARDFVLAAGGKITLANRVDGGAVATVELPLCQEKSV